MSDATAIAVIGLGGRFPGADDPDTLWTLLCGGIDAIQDVPSNRWAVPTQLRDSALYPRSGGFVQGADCFDAELFNISRYEAERMDPRQGLVLETGWQALEHAGIAPDTLAGARVGVFIGTSTNDFDRRLSSHWDAADIRAATGGSGAILANRLSYLLGVCGPSLSVDVACASSLSAVHLACQSLRLRECDLALSGGVHVILSPANMLAFARGGLLAKDGRTKCFSERADGYGCGEGCGMAVLKRLDDALRDEDHIWAVIRGSALNYNGASNGLGAPLGRAQEDVIRRALAIGNVQPASVGYVEAHSAGTLLGDAIEVKALKAALSEGRQPGQQCVVGSVKSNFGHLEGAAGMAGLLKAILAVHHGRIPKTLHSEPLSRHLRLEGSSVSIATCEQPWPASDHARRAGVSAFSFGGANAHVIVEEAPPQARGRAPASRASRWVLPISASSPTALRSLADRYAKALAALATEPNPRVAFADLCFTAAVARAHLSHRLAVIAGSAECARAELQAFLAGQQDNWMAGDVPRRHRIADVATADAVALARAYVSGPTPNWQACYADVSYRRRLLPTYPFQRQRYWSIPEGADCVT
jgi:acyl transferase domain-containing protein